jgi:hypothetical protein
VTVLRGHHRLQAEGRQAAGSAWTDSGGLVFTSRWGEPLYPDTVTALMSKLISKQSLLLPGRCLTPACTICAACTPQLCCLRGPRPRSSRPARSRRPGCHLARLLARTSRAHGGRRGHLRPGRESSS